MHMCEILNQLTAPCYLERTSCNTPQNVIKTKNAIKKAFRNQIEGKGWTRWTPWTSSSRRCCPSPRWA